MTTLISWVGVDPRGASSIYLASDSRISWGNANSWDTGRKLFASRTQPEIFGYCGDVTFPVQVLGQLIEQIDNSLLFDGGDLFCRKVNKVSDYVKASFIGYPKDHQREFQILYASRNHDGMASEFCISKISWNPRNGWRITNLNIPEHSGLIEGVGSGSESLKDWYIKWQASDSKRTSRSVFSAFCQSLKCGADPLSGGAPQLIGIYRKGVGRSFGIIYEGRRYLNGREVNSVAGLGCIEWRNKLFERCDGETMELLKRAQPQPYPRNL